MDNFILTAVDLHDKNMVTRFSHGRGQIHAAAHSNDDGGRAALVGLLRQHAQKAGGAQIVVVYEASSLGFTLRDFLAGQNIRCHIVAPTRIPRSERQRHAKTDEKDALLLLEVLRGAYLAGNELPEIAIPDQTARDHRELVRRRLEAQDQCTKVKTQIRMFLKRQTCLMGKVPRCGWTRDFRAWLDALSTCDEPLGLCARLALASLLREQFGPLRIVGVDG